MKYFCMRGQPIIFHLFISFSICCIVIQQVVQIQKSPQYFCLLLAFCKVEFCFYLEKQWSGQNLTNRTICYGLVINTWDFTQNIHHEFILSSFGFHTLCHQLLHSVTVFLYVMFYNSPYAIFKEKEAFNFICIFHSIVRNC